MRAGGVSLTLCALGAVGVAWALLARLDGAIDEAFGDVPYVPEGLAALTVKDQAGSGHERVSAAEDREIAPHGRQF
jgi:hypothetical protein